MKYMRIPLIILFLILQFILFEMFERFYYKFEVRYTKYISRVGIMPITKIFDNAAFNKKVVGKVFSDIKHKYDELELRTIGINYDNKKGKRIMFVGARSMGEGTGVAVDQTFSATFAKSFKKLRPNTEFEVINANRGNLSLSNTFHHLREVLFTKIRPDVVILGSYVLHESYPRHKGSSLEERVFGSNVDSFYDGRTIRKNGMFIVSKVPHSDMWYEVYSRSYAMAKALAYIDVKMAELSEKTNANIEPLQDHVGYIKDLKALLNKHDIPLLVVTIPQMLSPQNNIRTLVKEDLRRLCKDLHIPYWDIDNLRPAHAYTYVSNGHYSVESNELIGNDIANWADGILGDL